MKALEQTIEHDTLGKIKIYGVRDHGTGDEFGRVALDVEDYETGRTLDRSEWMSEFYDELVTRLPK